MNADPNPDPTKDESDGTPGKITVELDETECSIIKHALLVVWAWNRQEDDDGLARRHQDLRNKFIDAPDEFLRGNDD